MRVCRECVRLSSRREWHERACVPTNIHALHGGKWESKWRATNLCIKWKEMLNITSYVGHFSFCQPVIYSLTSIL